MIPEAIYTILSGDATLVATVPAARIQPVRLGQTTANPCILYEVQSQEPDYTKDGAASVIFTFLEVDIFSTSLKEAWEIEALVKSALDQYTGDTNGIDIDLIQWEGSDDGVYRADRDEYQLSMGFRIRQK